MFWVIRFTDRQTQQDKELVVEADTRLAAEAMAAKRGIPVDFLGEASAVDVLVARKNKRLWRYSPESQYRVFGQSATANHIACLMLCGIWTWLVVLHNAHVNLFQPFVR